ncbi:hypothetical protein C0995_015294, partial [Termitomyces sp. Mi166
AIFVLQVKCALKLDITPTPTVFVGETVTVSWSSGPGGPMKMNLDASCDGKDPFTVRRSVSTASGGFSVSVTQMLVDALKKPLP